MNGCRRRGPPRPLGDEAASRGQGHGSPRGTRLPWAPAHLKGLGEAGVQVEVVADHAAGSMALPVQHRVADVIYQPDGHHGELLHDGDPARQPFQLPVGLHSDECGAPALVLRQGEEDMS